MWSEVFFCGSACLSGTAASQLVFLLHVFASSLFSYSGWSCHRCISIVRHISIDILCPIWSFVWISLCGFLEFLIYDNDHERLHHIFKLVRLVVADFYKLWELNYHISKWFLDSDIRHLLEYRSWEMEGHSLCFAEFPGLGF